MKALACLLLVFCLATAPKGVAAEPASPAAKEAAPAEEAPEFVKLRDALVQLERDPATAADTFLAVYQLYEKGEEFAKAGNVPEAKPRFEAALRGLDAIRKRVPTWNPSIIEYRTNRVIERLAALPGAAPVEPAPRPKVTPGPAPSKAPSTFKEENRARPVPRQWSEREFNGEKLYLVPLVVLRESAGF